MLQYRLKIAIQEILILFINAKKDIDLKTIKVDILLTNQSNKNILIILLKLIYRTFYSTMHQKW